jgi:hypothetical protein
MLVKLSKGRSVELAVLIPATWVLVTALGVGILYALFVLVLGVWFGLSGDRHAFSNSVHSAYLIISLISLMVPASVGMGSLWFNVVLGNGWFYARPRCRIAVLSGLVVGLVTVVYWFWGIDLKPHDAVSAKGLVVWILLVLVPSILALRHLYSLLRPLRRKPV